MGCTRIGDAGCQLLLDDGTGRVTCVLWSSEDSTPPNPSRVYNKYVSISGQLLGFRSEVQVRVESIVVLTDTEEPTEECLWWMDVKDHWEALAVGSTKRECPCMCHVVLGQCSVIGFSFPPSFARAVHVLSSALRSLAASQPGGYFETSLEELLALVKDNLCKTPSVSAHACFATCAVAEAVRQLTRWKCVSRSSEGVVRFSIFPSPIPESTLGSPQDSLRYPATPREISQSLDDSAATVQPGKYMGQIPKFSAASSPWN